MFYFIYIFIITTNENVKFQRINLREDQKQCK